MNDIVTRLRMTEGGQKQMRDCREAADEIERLRAQVDELETENESLRKRKAAR